MRKFASHSIALLLGASATYVFAVSPLNPPYWAFYVGLACAGLLASLFLGRRTGLSAGLGIIATFTAIGILNGIDHGAAASTYLSLPIILATVFLIVTIGSFIGDGMRAIAAHFQRSKPKA